MHSIQRHIFVQNRFNGPWSSQRPSASIGLFFIILDDFEFFVRTGNETTFWIKAGTTAIIVVIYIGALMAPLFCPRNWFSKQLDGHAGTVLSFYVPFLRNELSKIFRTVLRCRNLQGSLIFIIKQKYQK